MPQPSPQYVFISYSRKDKAAMERIKEFLKNRGMAVWVDDEGLRAGEARWQVVVEESIKNASAIVAVLSPDAKDSEWVEREIVTANDHQKRIIPVLIKGDKNTSVPFSLKAHQRIDMRDNETKGLNDLLSALSSYLDKKALPEKPLEVQQRPIQVSPAKEEKILSVREPLFPTGRETTWKSESSLKPGNASADLGKRLPYPSRFTTRLSSDPKLSPKMNSALRDPAYTSKFGDTPLLNSTTKYTAVSPDWLMIIIFIVVSIALMFLANWAVYWLFSRFHVLLPEINLHWLALLIGALAWGLIVGFVATDGFYETSEQLGIGLGIGIGYLIGLGLVYGICYAGNHFFGVHFGTLFYWIFGAANAIAFVWASNYY